MEMTTTPPVSRPAAKVEEILALVKIAQRTTDPAELRGLLAGAKALARHAIHKKRNKVSRELRGLLLKAARGTGSVLGEVAREIKA